MFWKNQSNVSGQPISFQFHRLCVNCSVIYLQRCRADTEQKLGEDLRNVSDCRSHEGTPSSYLKERKKERQTDVPSMHQYQLHHDHREYSILIDQNKVSIIFSNRLCTIHICSPSLPKPWVSIFCRSFSQVAVVFEIQAQVQA